MLEALADGDGNVDLLPVIGGASIQARHCAVGGKGGPHP
jgi:hypothetical protein